MDDRITLALLSLSLLVSLCTLAVCVGLQQAAAARERATPRPATAGTCSAATCGAADPVSDPAYNMREIAKQSILLEEHLTVDSKYCVDCVAKHLLHCHALAVEAVMLACDRVAQYPYMAQSPEFFRGLTERWLADRDDAQLRRRIAAELREYRKTVVQAYFTGPGAGTYAQQLGS